MNGLFNGTCSHCERFKPRCALVKQGARTWSGMGGDVWITLCETCRRENKGKYTLHPQHRRERLIRKGSKVRVKSGTFLGQPEPSPVLIVRFITRGRRGEVHVFPPFRNHRAFSKWMLEEVRRA